MLKIASALCQKRKLAYVKCRFEGGCLLRLIESYLAKVNIENYIHLINEIHSYKVTYFTAFNSKRSGFY